MKKELELLILKMKRIDLKVEIMEEQIKFFFDRLRMKIAFKWIFFKLRMRMHFSFWRMKRKIRKLVDEQFPD